uniref:hypothetical protein n=1 Tax=Candidatus Electronema sp. TaxID=2698783 RepID=UPI0040564BF2
MDKERTRNVLQKLIEAFPNPLKEKNFEVPKGGEQDFRNFLMELNQRGFIDAGFVVGRTADTKGLPINVVNISITKKGREFMEGRNEQTPTSQVINIGTASGHLNIAARDINITNSADAEKVIEKLLELIEKSNLPDEKKKSLVGSVRSMISQVTPNLLAGLLVEAAKAALPI